MPKVVITHGVVDLGNWLNGKEERAGAIGAMGGVNVVDYVAQDGSNAIAITFDADDASTVVETTASPPPELADAMERHGLIPPLTIYVEQ
jgi:hypothetical protein